MRVFLDANIVFSAAWSDASPTQYLFRLADHGDCVLCSSEFALEEARRNLTREGRDFLPVFERLLASIQRAREPTAVELEYAARCGLPAKDTPILAAAIAAEANILVTGDRSHFGHLFGESVGEVRILTLADTLEALIAEGGVSIQAG